MKPGSSKISEENLMMAKRIHDQMCAEGKRHGITQLLAREFGLNDLTLRRKLRTKK
jgi:hypothetical protein